MPAHQATAVAIGGRAILIEGPPGIGKSSLALCLIDRGATLIGDDGLMLEESSGRLVVRPHPKTTGLIEVRNLGLLSVPVCPEAPACLLIQLDEAAPRFIEQAEEVRLCSETLPTISLWPRTTDLPIKAELALERFGLAAK